MDPINYTGMQTNVDPGQALLGGLKTGAVIRDVQFQNQQRELQQQQLQRQQQDLMTLMNNPNPTAQDYANYALRNPQQAEATKQAFGLLDEQRQRQTIGIASRVYSALQSGRTDLAQELLEQQKTALSNGGNPGDAEANNALLEVVKTDPKTALNMAGTFLASAMGPKDFASTFQALGKEVREQGLAGTKQQQAQADLENTKSQIDTRGADLEIKRADTQIKALNAQIAKEGNEIKRADLQQKLDAAKVKKDQLDRDKAAATEGTISSIDNALDTISKIESAPGLSGAVGLTGAIPSVPGSDAANATALVEQLQSQAFLNAVKQMQGLGALSDAEGAKINNSIASLNPKQSEKQFRAQLGSIKSIFEKARERTAKQGNVTVRPHAGVVMKHPVYGDITNERIEAAAKKAGITPEQLRKRLEAAQ